MELAAPVEAKTIALKIEPITPAGFAPYGTLIERTWDGKPFGADEAQLVVNRGTPRFYIMDLKQREMAFRHITRHLAVTQCLAAVGGKEWVIAVAPPDQPDNPSAKPDITQLRAFRIAGDQAIMLGRGTWHAGPFFEAPEVAFFNLELADTNVVDHHNCLLDAEFGVRYRFV